ncbi:hypothetical protein HY572_03895 [Candidatus Micrarchaeota archaeon]|nr:hypothetical protein [Candidatus Micrarchaeota archaeon]
MNVPDVAVGVLSSPVFWSTLSFTLALAFTWWFLQVPRKWWVLAVAGVCVFLLFDFGGLPFGLTGFFAGIGLRLWKASRQKRALPRPRRRP